MHNKFTKSLVILRIEKFYILVYTNIIENNEEAQRGAQYERMVNTMTNAQIVFNAQIELMNAGIIGTTGNTLEVELPDGTTQEMPEPEAIHTYKAWQRLGYQVKRGEHAVTDLHIWKHTTKKLPEAVLGDDEETKMFFTKAYFFSASQVEPIRKTVDPSEYVGKKMTIEINQKKRRA